MSYIPMVEYEVTLRVKTPYHEPEPEEWDWAGIADEWHLPADGVEFHSQRVVRTYNKDVTDA